MKEADQIVKRIHFVGAEMSTEEYESFLDEIVELLNMEIRMNQRGKK